MLHKYNTIFENSDILKEEKNKKTRLFGALPEQPFTTFKNNVLFNYFPVCLSAFSFIRLARFSLSG